MNLHPITDLRHRIDRILLGPDPTADLHRPRLGIPDTQPLRAADLASVAEWGSSGQPADTA